MIMKPRYGDKLEKSLERLLPWDVATESQVRVGFVVVQINVMVFPRRLTGTELSYPCIEPVPFRKYNL